MSNLAAFFFGSILMFVTLAVLDYWIILRNKRPYVTKKGDIICISPDGHIRKAVWMDDNIIGVAVDEGIIQSNGTYLVKVNIGGQRDADL